MYWSNCSQVIVSERKQQQQQQLETETELWKKSQVDVD